LLEDAVAIVDIDIDFRFGSESKSAFNPGIPAVLSS
jgi:hypothetical protein